MFEEFPGLANGLILGGGGILVLFFVRSFFSRRKGGRGKDQVEREKLEEEEEALKLALAKEGKEIILHQFPRSYWSANLSPFCLKVETYLRMSKIPYKVSEDFKFSSKGKLPWISVGGKEVADSHFILLFLEKAFEVPLDSHLGPKERSLHIAFQRMIEEHLYFVSLYFLCQDEEGAEKGIKYFYPSFFASLFAKYVGKQVLKSLYGQGIGRFSKKEVKKVLQEDIFALSQLLSEKSFMLGEVPSSFDSLAFAALVVPFSLPFEDPIKSEITRYPNLVEYIERMKERYWSDWDDLTSSSPIPSGVHYQRKQK